MKWEQEDAERVPFPVQITIDEIKALQEKVVRFSEAVNNDQVALILFKGVELRYLLKLFHNDIGWRSWLIPGE